MKRLALLVLAGCGDRPVRPDAGPGPDAAACAVTVGEPALGLERVVDGLDRPVHLTAPSGDGRLFVLELARGLVRVIGADRVLREAPFLSIADQIGAGFEQGILSLAFHPGYADDGRFYLSWARDGDDALVVEEWRVDPDDPDRADPGSRRTLLEIPHPTDIHYGAHLAFDARGRLLVASGDGGPQLDPEGHGQDLGSLRGKLLRIDVDRRSGDLPYAIPEDNPLIDRPGARPEILAWGLRNPWRFAIDPASQHVYLGDVGFDSVEEVDVLPAGADGMNFGWAVVEGAECVNPPVDCTTRGLEPPAYSYGHGEGCAVIVGPVYRGCAMPGHHGKLFFGDFCGGWVRSLIYSQGEVAFVTDHPALTINDLSGFGVDGLGEMYLLDFDRGTVDRIVPVP